MRKLRLRQQAELAGIRIQVFLTPKPFSFFHAKDPLGQTKVITTINSKYLVNT